MKVLPSYWQLHYQYLTQKKRRQHLSNNWRQPFSKQTEWKTNYEDRVKANRSSIAFAPPKRGLPLGKRLLQSNQTTSIKSNKTHPHHPWRKERSVKVDLHDIIIRARLNAKERRRRTVGATIVACVIAEGNMDWTWVRTLPRVKGSPQNKQAFLASQPH